MANGKRKKNTGAMTKQKTSKRGSDKKAFQLHPAQCQKIRALRPDLFKAVHQVLKSNGIEAVVHTIGFRSASAKGRRASVPCCNIGGIMYCPCPD